MKNTILRKLAGFVLSLFCSGLFAQDVELFAITPFPIEITYNKTVNLVFPYAIKSVDLGSRDVLAQKAKGVEHILQLKSATKYFEQTNLTVIGSDDKLYSFVVSYAAEPAQLNIELVSSDDNRKMRQPNLNPFNENILKNTAALAAQSAKKNSRIRRRSHKTAFSLRGIFISNDALFFDLQLSNHSAISYDIENLRFFIADKKIPKRTAAQQTEIIPLYVHGNPGRVEACSNEAFVFALPKFTIPAAKKLIIEVMEKNGGRHHRLKLQNRRILRARQLADIL